MIGLSNRQYPMLQAFSNAGYMSIDEAKAFDQRPFRSMLMRKYITYHPGKGFRITKEGARAWGDFHNTEIIRKNFNMPLTAYFDPTAYGLKKAKVLRMPRKKVA